MPRPQQNRAVATFLLLYVLFACVGAVVQAQECIFPISHWDRTQLSPSEPNEAVPLARAEEIGLNTSDYKEVIAKLPSLGFEQIPVDVEDRFRRLALAVGRLQVAREVDDATCIQACTGWLISPRYLFTARHCLPDSVTSTTRIGFRIDYQNGRPGKLISVQPHMVVESPPEALDYAILELTEDVQAEYFLKYGGFETLIFSKSELRLGHSFATIGHPMGAEKKLNRQGCHADELGLYDAQFIRHHCITLNGSSGSPIFDEFTGEVIGLHTKGSRGAAGEPQYGIPMASIVRDLESRLKSDAAQFVDLSLALRSAGVSFDRPTMPTLNTDAQAAHVKMLAENERGPVRLGISLANLTSTEITESDVDGVLGVINTFLKGDMSDNEPDCPVQYYRNSENHRFEELGIGAGTSAAGFKIDTLSDLDFVLGLPGNLKVVDRVNWCGRIGFGITECTRLGSPSSVFSWNRQKRVLARTVLHALGHQAGAAHSDAKTNFMFPITSSQVPEISREQCAALFSVGQKLYEFEFDEG